jgi:hypothetical protein
MQTLSFAAVVTLLLAPCVKSEDFQLTDCGLLGPVYPVPCDLASSKAVEDAQATFERLIDDALQNKSTPWGPFNGVNTSISVGVFST